MGSHSMSLVELRFFNAWTKTTGLLRCSPAVQPPTFSQGDHFCNDVLVFSNVVVVASTKKSEGLTCHKNASTPQTRPCWPFVLAPPTHRAGDLPFTTTKWAPPCCALWQTCNVVSAMDGRRSHAPRRPPVQVSVRRASDASTSRRRLHLRTLRGNGSTRTPCLLWCGAFSFSPMGVVFGLLCPNVASLTGVAIWDFTCNHEAVFAKLSLFLSFSLSLTKKKTCSEIWNTWSPHSTNTAGTVTENPRPRCGVGGIKLSKKRQSASNEDEGLSFF